MNCLPLWTKVLGGNKAMEVRKDQRFIECGDSRTGVEQRTLLKGDYWLVHLCMKC